MPLNDHAPIISSIAGTNATVNVAYLYQIAASDADGDVLTYSLEIAPAGMTINATTGLINWTPTLAQVGNQAVKVGVSDGTDSVFQEYTITVSLPPNNPPVITSAPITTATTEILYAYDVNATDADLDTLTYSLEIAPAGMTINATTGLINWTPSLAQTGNNTVKVQVSDGTDAVFQEYTITVSLPPNNPPVITSVPITTATSKTPYTYDVNATDADGDTLTYSLYEAVSTPPAGMSINSVSGVINWTPSLFQQGEYTVIVQVSDGTDAVFQRYIIIVSVPPDNSPIITSTPITATFTEILYTYGVIAVDIDGDTLAYSLVIKPTGMTINATTGLINWTPNLAQVGDHTVKVLVSDGVGADFQEYTITVSLSPPNFEPEITSDPIRTAIAEREYIYTVIADDLDGDILTYNLTTSPAGMTIDPITGKISWTPTSAQIGNYKVVVTASDGELSDTQKFAIRVIPTDNGITYQRGCTMTTWWFNDLEQLVAIQTADKMKADGCEYIAILVTQYQDTISSTTIYPIASKTPSDNGLILMTTYIHSIGLKVALKPHVDVLSGAWRGEITFTLEADWLAWFASYLLFINHYLDLAEANQVEMFILGTEYKATEFREADWRAQIANARTKFSGLLSYGANHDSYFNILWWDALDFIGVDAYFPLTSSYSPTVAELNTAWLPYVSALQNFAVLHGQDIVFTEFGYQSLDGTNTSPWWAP